MIDALSKSEIRRILPQQQKPTSNIIYISKKLNYFHLISGTIQECFLLFNIVLRISDHARRQKGNKTHNDHKRRN